VGGSELNENRVSRERGQSLVLVAAAMVVLVGFVALAVDLGNAYYARRTAQNAADGAALAGVSAMATGINKNNPKLDDDVMEAMDEFAELNDIAYVDTDGDGMNDSVEGYYVDGLGNRLPGDPRVGVQPGDDVPADAYGVEAITHITATAFFGGIFGVEGYPLQARAVSLVRFACSSNCVVPIVTAKDALFDNQDQAKTKACYNIWSESELGEPGSYGWISWTWQQAACQVETRPCPPYQQGTGCSEQTLATNLDPINCGTGYVETGDWVANSTGISNADEGVRCALDYYLGIPRVDCTLKNLDLGPIPFTIVVYDYTNISTDNPKPSACGGDKDYDDLSDPDTWGLHYHVAGFAQMQILGYELSQGGTNVSAQMNDLEYLRGLEWDPTINLDDGFDPMVDCWNPPTAFRTGNRITAYFMNWVTSYSSSNECYDPWGTLLSSPKLTE
jgi:hypothetical protein